MQVSLKWLKDYVNIELSTEELAHHLTMVGLEVDGINKLGEGIKKVLIGEILEVNPHPQADKLLICSVDIGSKELPLTIITGASNVKKGMKVPVALVGAMLPGGINIGKATFRGIDSYGMLCSAKELGIDSLILSEEEKDGIMSVPQNTPVGKPIQEILGLDDEVLEIDLTPNRSDCLSMINIAREVSAITGAPLKMPKTTGEGENKKIEQLASVQIDAPDLCGRYVARIVENVKIGSSPLWLKHRLQAAGVRSINNIVDVTNFVMLEMGQPLHAFDYNKLNGHKIIVRRSKNEEKIVTLDGNERQLDENMLVIADASAPVAIAGIMGGIDSEVTSSTKTILLESAFFEGVSIRKSSRKLGLRSEASSRFEKGINIDGALGAINRAADLIQKLGAGNPIPGKIDVFPSKLAKVILELRPSRVNHILGTSISTKRMIEFLQRLSFDCQQKKDDLIVVTVPSYRRDVTQEIDLIEEIARLYGYSNIPTTMPESTMTHSSKSLIQLLEERAKEVLVGCGMTEIINYSFIGSKSFDKIQLKANHPWREYVQIMNPLSDEQNVMRTTLIAGMLEVAARNINRRQTDLALFESGKVFLPQGINMLPLEEPMLSGLISGGLKKTWNWPAEKYDFYYLKGILQQLLTELNQDNVVFAPTNGYDSFHPGRTAEVIIGNEVIGVIGELHPLVLENYNIDQKIWLFELKLIPLLYQYAKVKQYETLPKYPAVERDMALLIPEEITSNQVEQKIAAVGGEFLVKYRLFDVYKGKQIPKGFKSMAYNMLYQAKNKTLTDQEVSAIHNKIHQELQSSFGAKLR